MNQIKSLTLCVSLVVITACTTTQGTDALKALSYLFGGQPDRAQMLDATVEEALQYEFDRCISGQELTAEVQSECIKTAYATVKEDMNLEERVGEDGRVIIERVDDEDMIYEDDGGQENNN
ncbi:hypothetical protein [Kangiella koreensis]|uniref:Lipoprotein n=1 Tax=Kangiella koreensis (strain DSM 16069 / JCM 12317 / KCTC 12182 / SW-125) TaxID=523791 RepID=C7R8C2_KANKD|nr:hypothetical protein [Kangiella koreensis]ACV27687.1 hypothetical protein Kkor_2278 [Kangiella koreensis DSM 16069]